MKICKNCGEQYPDGKFCRKCGSALVDQEVKNDFSFSLVREALDNLDISYLNGKDQDGKRFILINIENDPDCIDFFIKIYELEQDEIELKGLGVASNHNLTTLNDSNYFRGLEFCNECNSYFYGIRTFIDDDKEILTSFEITTTKLTCEYLKEILHNRIIATSLIFEELKKKPLNM